MCIEVTYKENTIETIGELEEILGIPFKKMVIFPNYGEITRETCLCPINLVATFKKANIEFEMIHSMEYLVK